MFSAFEETVSPSNKHRLIVLVDVTMEKLGISVGFATFVMAFLVIDQGEDRVGRRWNTPQYECKGRPRP